MDRWKAEQGRGREKRKSRRERVRRKKIQMREKVGKSRFTVFFQWFVAPEGRKVGSLKRRVRSQLARCEMKKCTPLWREAHFQVKMYKTHHSRTTFGSWDFEKVHAVVARSTFPSQNVQSTPAPDHFWKLRCRKSARRCGAKHISKSKCTKHTRFGPLLEVEMSKKCTPLWREAHFEVKMYKTHHVRTTFGSWDVEKVHAVVARSTFPSQNVQNTPCSDHFWRFRCRKSARRCGAKHISKSKWQKHHVRTTFGGSDVASLHYTTLRYTTLHYIILHNTTLHYTTFHHTSLYYNYNYNYTTTPHYTPLHYITPHHTTLHYTTFLYTSLQYTTLHSTTLQIQLHNDTTTQLHSTTLHYTKLNHTTLHYTTLHNTTTKTTQLHNYTPLNYTTLHYTTLHYLPLHFTALHYTTTTTTQLHSTTLHYTTLHNITLHYTTFHYTALHYITLHCITLNDIAPQIDR